GDPAGSVGRRYVFRMVLPAGLWRPAGMMSNTPGVDGDWVNAPPGLVGSGSWSPLRGRQPLGLPGFWKAGSRAASEKSPLRCKGVGTCAVRTTPAISRFHSSDTKKKTLSFLIGPPNENPKSLRRIVFFLDFGSIAFRTGSLASSRSLRPK